MMLERLLADGAPPIVAILRGMEPEQCEAIGAALTDAGIRLIEVPLNSPRPLESIALLSHRYGQRCLIGAGTVMSSAAVDQVREAGGRLIVTPTANPDVIAHAAQQGLDVMPGFVTPTEAFMALAAGARALKLFPAASLGIPYMQAIRDVLPRGTQIWPVGGVGAANLASWLHAGASGIGVGGSLFRPGDATETVRTRALALVDAWQKSQRPER